MDSEFWATLVTPQEQETNLSRREEVTSEDMDSYRCIERDNTVERTRYYPQQTGTTLGPAINPISATERLFSGPRSVANKGGAGHYWNKLWIFLNIRRVSPIFRT